MGKAIGIDLGTTNTAVAVLIDGRPRVIEDDKGYKVLPSCVSMQPGGKAVVGQAARSLALTQPDRTVQAVKRLIGRRFDSPEVEQIRRRAGFGIKPAPDGTCLVVMAGETWTPVQVSALVLQHAREIAEKALDETVDEAVITVPAYFNHAQRSATFEAARLAGLRCERLLNEPTAAALAYGFRKDLNRTILIYDLGGGTFDVSVLQLSKGVYEVLATAGDTFLGGEDFDHRLVDHLADHFQSTHNMDLRTDREALQRLKDASERAKCELSFTDRTNILIPRITLRDNLELAVTRLTLEGLVEDMVERSLQITRQAVTDAGLKIADIDDVVLVGGQTRMPRVREAIGALFQKEPSRSVHPEEVVAIGAAVHAHSLVNPEASKPLLLDVTPFDLGIDVAGGLFQTIITKNSHVPASGTRTFATAHDNQDNVQVTVRQGESRFAAENEFLGRFVMAGLPPAPRMGTKVEVTFRLDSNGMLHATALEVATGERKRITIRNYAEIAQSEGKVEAVIEGDTGAPTAAAPAPAAAAKGKGKAKKEKVAKATGPGAADAGVKEKAGLLGKLFGRKSAAPAANAPAVAAGSPVPPAPAPPVAAGDRWAADEPAQVQPEELAEVEPETLGVGALQMLEPLDEEPGPLPFEGGGLIPLDDLGAGDEGFADAFAMPAEADDPFASADPFAPPAPAPASADPFADPFAGPAPAPASADPFARDPFDAPEDDSADAETGAFTLPLGDDDDLAQARPRPPQSGGVRPPGAPSERPRPLRRWCS